MPNLLVSFAQIGAFDFRILAQISCFAFHDNLSRLHDIGAVGDLEGSHGILFDQEQSDTLVV